MKRNLNKVLMKLEKLLENPKGSMAYIVILCKAVAEISDENRRKDYYRGKIISFICKHKLWAAYDSSYVEVLQQLMSISRAEVGKLKLMYEFCEKAGMGVDTYILFTKGRIHEGQVAANCGNDSEREYIRKIAFDPKINNKTFFEEAQKLRNKYKPKTADNEGEDTSIKPKVNKFEKKIEKTLKRISKETGISINKTTPLMEVLSQEISLFNLVSKLKKDNNTYLKIPKAGKIGKLTEDDIVNAMLAWQKNPTDKNRDKLMRMLATLGKGANLGTLTKVIATGFVYERLADEKAREAMKKIGMKKADLLKYAKLTANQYHTNVHRYAALKQCQFIGPNAKKKYLPHIGKMSAAFMDTLVNQSLKTIPQKGGPKYTIKQMQAIWDNCKYNCADFIDRAIHGQSADTWTIGPYKIYKNSMGEQGEIFVGQIEAIRAKIRLKRESDVSCLEALAVACEGVETERNCKGIYDNAKKKEAGRKKATKKKAKAKKNAKAAALRKKKKKVAKKKKKKKST